MDEISANEPESDNLLGRKLSSLTTLDARLDSRIVSRTVNYLILDGVEYLASDIIEALESLRNTDGFMSFSIMDDPAIEELLMKYGVAEQSVRGGMYRKSNYLEFCKRIGHVLGYGNDWELYIATDRD